MLVETEVITDVNEKQFETTGVVEWSQEFKSRAQLWRGDSSCFCISLVKIGDEMQT